MSLLDFNEEKRPSHFRLKPAKVLIALGSVCILVLGYSFAGNINLNNNQAVEFGQGVVKTVACDQDGITLTPYSSFINGDSNFTPLILTANSDGIESGRLLYTIDNLSSIRVGDSVQGQGIPSDSFITNISGGYFAINNSYSAVITSTTLTISRPVGRFLLNKIQLADVDSENCANKSFTVKVYSTTDSSPLATYEVFDTGSDFTSGNGAIVSNFENPLESAMLLTIDEPTVAATDVERMTIESKDMTNLALSRIGIWPISIDCPAGTSQCQIPESSTDSDFYCADGVCDIAFSPAYNVLQTAIGLNCNGIEICIGQAQSLLSTLTWSISKSDVPDDDMGWEILVSQLGIFSSNLHLSGRVLYSNGQYAVFRWYQNTGEPNDSRNYVDLILSFRDSLPISRPYVGPLSTDLPFELPVYQLTWNY